MGVEVVCQILGENGVPNAEACEAVGLGQGPGHQQVAITGYQVCDRLTTHADECLVHEKSCIRVSLEKLRQGAHVESGSRGIVGVHDDRQGRVVGYFKFCEIKSEILFHRQGGLGVRLGDFGKEDIGWSEEMYPLTQPVKDLPQDQFGTCVYMHQSFRHAHGFTDIRTQGFRVGLRLIIASRYFGLSRRHGLLDRGERVLA